MLLCMGNYEHFSFYEISLFIDKKLSENEKISIFKNVWVPDNNFNITNQQIGLIKIEIVLYILWLTKYKVLINYLIHLLKWGTIIEKRA